MYVDLEALCIHSNYVGVKIQFYFDRKTYQIIDSKIPTSNDEPYKRYIPLFTVDEDRIEYEFVKQLNQKKITKLYNDKDVHFQVFLENSDLWNTWRRYYYEKVKKLAIEWCEINNIRYKSSD